MQRFSGVTDALKAAVLSGLLLAPALALATEASFERTLTVGSTVLVYVSTGSGYVHVSPGRDSQLHVSARVKSNGSSWFGGGSPDDHVKEIAANPPIEQSGNEVRIGKKGGDWQRNISIDYEVTAPKGATVTVGSGSGDLKVSDMLGGLKASTGSGSIEVRGIGGNVALDTGSGDIRAELINPTMMKAQTGSGSIHLSGVNSSLKADTGSGDIEVQGQPSSEWKLVTGSGSVSLTTGSSKLTLDASTGSGTVHSDPPISTHGSFDRHHVTGEINGGGPMVRVETGSGDIRIK